MLNYKVNTDIFCIFCSSWSPASFRRANVVAKEVQTRFLRSAIIVGWRCVKLSIKNASIRYTNWEPWISWNKITKTPIKNTSIPSAPVISHKTTLHPYVHFLNLFRAVFMSVLKMENILYIQQLFIKDNWFLELKHLSRVNAKNHKWCYVDKVYVHIKLTWSTIVFTAIQFHSELNCTIIFVRIKPQRFSNEWGAQSVVVYGVRITVGIKCLKQEINKHSFRWK